MHKRLDKGEYESVCVESFQWGRSAIKKWQQQKNSKSSLYANATHAGSGSTYNCPCTTAPLPHLYCSPIWPPLRCSSMLIFPATRALEKASQTTPAGWPQKLNEIFFMFCQKPTGKCFPGPRTLYVAVVYLLISTIYCYLLYV